MSLICYDIWHPRVTFTRLRKYRENMLICWVQSYLCSVTLSEPKRFVEKCLVCNLVTVQLPQERLIRRSYYMQPLPFARPQCLAEREVFEKGVNLKDRKKPAVFSSEALIKVYGSTSVREESQTLWVLKPAFTLVHDLSKQPLNTASLCNVRRCFGESFLQF